MKDRIVEFPNRYLMALPDGSSILVDLTPAPGEIVEEGTLLNKATLLSDGTSAQIWRDAQTRPADPTVDEAFYAVAQGVRMAGMGQESTFQKLIMGRLF